MTNTLTPESVSELAEAVRATPRLLAVGALTKPRLSAVTCTKLSTAKLSGIVEYEPSEFTFTALAGTPVRDIISALAERGQYLPFDPMWVDAGATLGGTVAAGVSGPGRFRFGGLRDFILGVQFVDGAGRLLRLGGKVVKNAAGFDVPKFFVGSLGRFGVLVEITFKVFPQPASRLTLQLEARDAESAVKILTAAASSRWELGALDWLPDGKAIAIRLGGPAIALESLAKEILSLWPGQKLTKSEANELWTGLREFGWTNDRPPHEPLVGSHRREDAESAPHQEIPPPDVGGYGSGVQSANLSGNSQPGPLPREKNQSPSDGLTQHSESAAAASGSALALSARAGVRVRSEAPGTTGNILIKVALAPSDVVAFHKSLAPLEGARAHVSAGGNVAFVSLATVEQAATLHQTLATQNLSGMTLRGDAPLWLGARNHFHISAAVKAALDAENRFPSLED